MISKHFYVCLGDKQCISSEDFMQEYSTFLDFRPLNCANSRLLFNPPNISPITKQELRRWWCQQTWQHHVMGSFLELAKPIYKQMSSLQMAATTFYQARWGENGLINSSLKAGFGGKKPTLYSIMIILVKVGKKLVKNYIASTHYLNDCLLRFQK